MNTASKQVQESPVIYLERPVVGLTSPEFQTFAQEVIKAIGRMTKNSAKAFGRGLGRAYRFIERKWNEGADYHNRMQAIHDERYARNFYHIRSMGVL